MSAAVRLPPPRFQSTPPVKAATGKVVPAVHQAFISIHAAREGGDCHSLRPHPVSLISIHAAREGGDVGIAFSS